MFFTLDLLSPFVVGNLHSSTPALQLSHWECDGYDDHYFSDDEDDSAVDCDIVKITDDEMLAAVAPLFAAREADVVTYEGQREWACAVCHDSSCHMSKADVVNHLHSRYVF